MSTTRHAKTGSPFRQERFASSAEFERGLLGNLVARRCELIESDADRNLVWWLQLLSWAEGGLPRLAADLIATYPARIVSATMLKFGFKPGQMYNSEQVRAVSLEVNYADEAARCILLSDEALVAMSGEEMRDQYKPCPASEFVDLCRCLAGEELPRLLAEICLDPELKTDQCAPRYFPALIETLREHQTAWVKTRSAGVVVTEIGRQVYESLDYCLETRKMVLVDGLARTGKTFSVKAWCNLHPGQARYVQVPSSNDDIGFFRAIAKSLGVSINQNSKAQQLRDRIEDTLQRGKLSIVFDEAHFAWPQGSYREALPARINWIMTALVNQGVPVALVTTPQFMRAQSAVERKSHWTSEQFIGRIGDYKKLPDSLSTEDLTAVARALLPDGCAKSIETLVVYAQGSAKYLAAIEASATRAKYDAKKSGRQKVTFADVRDAIKGSIIPSDTALAGALAAPVKPGRSRAIPAPLPMPERTIEPPVSAARQARPEAPKPFNHLEPIEAVA